MLIVGMTSTQPDSCPQSFWWWNAWNSSRMFTGQFWMLSSLITLPTVALKLVRLSPFFSVGFKACGKTCQRQRDVLDGQWLKGGSMDFKIESWKNRNLVSFKSAQNLDSNRDSRVLRPKSPSTQLIYRNLLGILLLSGNLSWMCHLPERTCTASTIRQCPWAQDLANPVHIGCPEALDGTPVLEFSIFFQYSISSSIDTLRLKEHICLRLLSTL
jgi:hypothetical protein